MKQIKQMKPRSRSEIIGAILEAANGGGATKTMIMYKAILSYDRMIEYLLSLAEDSLIEYEQGRTRLLRRECVYFNYIII